jgi:hypothetical protein
MERKEDPWKALLGRGDLPEVLTVARLMEETGLKRRSVGGWLSRRGVQPVSWYALAYRYRREDVLAAVEVAPGRGNWAPDGVATL